MSETLGTWDWLVGELTRSYLLDRAQLQPVVEELLRLQPYADATALAGLLIREGLLTRFQVERILHGDVRSLVLGPYILAEPLGSGSLGTVYRGAAKADRTACAVKVLPMRSIWNVRMARRQVRTFADLPRHDVIVPFIDVGTANGKHYLVWPLTAGETLEAVVRREGPLPWQDAARIAWRIVEGLQICHQRGIFHGLIKPSNVMLGPDRDVRLLDFGIGALLAENTDDSLLDTMSTANATAGMLDCASPESLIDPSKRSPAGDQYSLGCVLYWSLSGKYPYPQGNLVEKIMAHQMSTPEPLRDLRPDVPPELLAVIDRLMHKSAEGRYRQVSDVHNELASIMEGLRSGYKPTPTATRDTLGKTSSVEDTPALSRLDVATAPDLAVPPPLPDPPPDERPPADGPPPPPARRGILARLFQRLAFWKPRTDLVSVSVLAPSVLDLGETAMMPLVVHAHGPDEALQIGRTYCPYHRMAGTYTLRNEVPRREKLSFHLALPGITVEPPVQKLAWTGQAMPLPFTVNVPPDCRPGEIVGIVSIGEGDDVVTFEFRIQVGRE